MNNTKLKRGYVWLWPILIGIFGCATTQLPEIDKEYISKNQKTAIVHFSGSKVIASAPGEDTQGDLGLLKEAFKGEKPVGYDLVNEGYGIFVEIFNKSQHFEILSKDAFISQSAYQKFKPKESTGKFRALKKLADQNLVRNRLAVPDEMYFVADYEIDSGKLAVDLGVDNVIFIYNSFSFQESRQEQTKGQKLLGDVAKNLTGGTVEIDLGVKTYVRADLTLRMYNKAGKMVWRDVVWARSREEVSAPKEKLISLDIIPDEEIKRLYPEVFEFCANILIERLNNSLQVN